MAEPRPDIILRKPKAFGTRQVAPTPPPPRRGDAQRQAMAIGAAIACITVVGISLSLSSPLITLMLADRGISATVIGLNTSIASLATLLIGSFVTPLAVRLGLRRALILALSVGGLTLAAFSVLDSLAAWFALRFLFGAAAGTLFVLSEFWINAAAPVNRRGVIMGVYATALSAGFAAGPAILALAGGAKAGLFLVGTVFFVLAAIPILLAGDLAPPLHGKPQRSPWSFAAIAPIATFAAFVFGAIEQGSFAFLTLYGETLGYSTSHAALLLVCFGLGNVASQLPIGFLSDHMDRRVLLLCCGAVAAAGALLMPLASPTVLAMLGVVFVTGGMVGGLYTVGLAHLGARFDGSDLATANAAFVIFYSLGMLTASPAFGVIVDTVKPHGFAFAFAGLCLAYCLLVVLRMAGKGS
jgi:MFS family permease